jgi:hypothetical protein
MKTPTTLGVVALVLVLAGCATIGKSLVDTSSQEAPVAMTVAQATAENARYIDLIVGPDPEIRVWRDTAQIGCRTNPESLMSEGPPWHVRTNWVVSDPPAEFVEGALARVDTLAAKGFRLQPWIRPDPEPPNNRTYRDDRGYLVGVMSDTTPAGEKVFDITVSSPCVYE